MWGEDWEQVSSYPHLRGDPRQELLRDLRPVVHHLGQRLRQVGDRRRGGGEVRRAVQLAASLQRLLCMRMCAWGHFIMTISRMLLSATIEQLTSPKCECIGHS